MQIKFDATHVPAREAIFNVILMSVSLFMMPPSTVNFKQSMCVCVCLFVLYHAIKI